MFTLLTSQTILNISDRFMKKDLFCLKYITWRGSSEQVFTSVFMTVEVEDECELITTHSHLKITILTNGPNSHEDLQ